MGLYSQGYPSAGTLRRYRWPGAEHTLHDWMEKVEFEYRQLKSEYKDVVVIGFSLGALLTLQLALHHPIERIILMGTPLFLIREYLPINALIGVC